MARYTATIDQGMFSRYPYGQVAPPGEDFAADRDCKRARMTAAECFHATTPRGPLWLDCNIPYRGAVCFSDLCNAAAALAVWAALG